MPWADESTNKRRLGSNLHRYSGSFIVLGILCNIIITQLIMRVNTVLTIPIDSSSQCDSNEPKTSPIGQILTELRPNKSSGMGTSVYSVLRSGSEANFAEEVK